MKIIDLLNKIAKGEEVPEKIKLKGYDYIFTLREDCTGYRWYGEEKTNEDFGESICQNLEFVLRCEVEILDDEEKELPEKLGECACVDGEIAYSWSKSEAVLKTKINELIDYLEKQKKGE